MTTIASKEARLAANWTKSRVIECLNNQLQPEVIRFINERYSERFFEPISVLRGASGNYRGFGFAIMALCSLMIETLECYREGLPSSHPSELTDLEKSPANGSAPTDYRLQGPFKNVGSGKVFDRFFGNTAHQRFFPGVSGGTFYQEIRCGLLHQAQTKGGWKIVKDGPFWDNNLTTIGRNEFAARLRECFDAYLAELLADSNWNSNPWKGVRKKIWWLAQIS